jgi:hypothetical protein
MPAPTIVQHKSGFASNATSASVTLNSNVGAGNMILVFAGSGSTAAPTPVNFATPTMTGETFSPVSGASQGGTSGHGQSACYAVNSAVGGQKQVTITASGSGTPSDIHVHVIEISGQAASPINATGNTESTTLSVSTSGATTVAACLIIAFFFDDANNRTFSAGSGYATIEQSNDVAGGDAGYSESKTVSSTGTQTATATGNSGDTVEQSIIAIAGAATVVTASVSMSQKISYGSDGMSPVF